MPALAWGVWKGGEVWKGAVGATTRTPFSLASVTKPMTATAVMRLVERGLVDLDAPISDYLE
ncbi:MAG: class A beta-lactamase-related serine hydrolase, partial [Oxalobacteraceae bacterium]